jgi:hypothetical protein
VPRLVDKMGITGNRINLTSQVFKLVIDSGQILQFRGTHKGKIRGIKEKYRPTTQHIVFGYGFKGIPMKGMYGKIGYFSV